MPLDGEAQELEHRDVADAAQVHVVGLSLGLVYRGEGNAVAALDSLVVGYRASVALREFQAKGLLYRCNLAGLCQGAV